LVFLGLAGLAYVAWMGLPLTNGFSGIVGVNCPTTQGPYTAGSGPHTISCASLGLAILLPIIAAGSIASFVTAFVITRRAVKRDGAPPGFRE